MDYYPYTFQPILRRAGWGGRTLRKTYGKRPSGTDPEPVAESSELWQDRGGGSVVDRGPCKGTSLRELLRRDPEGVLGPAVAMRSPGAFPLDVRLREAGADGPLEVRAAPEGPIEATLPRSMPFAAWFVMEAASGARLRRGVLPGTTLEELRAAARGGTLHEHVNVLPARTGEAVFLPPGTVYGLGTGVVVYEVALRGGDVRRLESGAPGADTKRTGRAEAERALAAVDLRTMGVRRSEPVRLHAAPHRRDLLLRCEGFTLELLHLSKRLVEKPDGQRFAALTCISGRATVRHDGAGPAEVPLPSGRTVLIPARLSSYEIIPDLECRLLKVFIE